MTEVGDGSISARLRTWTAAIPIARRSPRSCLTACGGASARSLAPSSNAAPTGSLATSAKRVWVSTTSSPSGCPNGIVFYETTIAAWKCGATPLPISYRLPERERGAIIELAEPKLVVVVPIEPAPELSDDPLPDDPIAASWKAPTSGGSTGRPKIILSGAPATANPDREGPFGMGLDGVHLVPGPLYHNGPFVFSTQALWTGNHIVVLSRFDAETSLEAIDRFRVNWMMLVPTMMQRIWRLPEDVRDRYDLSSLRAFLHLAACAAPIAPTPRPRSA